MRYLVIDEANIVGGPSLAFVEARSPREASTKFVDRFFKGHYAVKEDLIANYGTDEDLTVIEADTIDQI